MFIYIGFLCTLIKNLTNLITLWGSLHFSHTTTQNDNILDTENRLKSRVKISTKFQKKVNNRFYKTSKHEILLKTTITWDCSQCRECCQLRNLGLKKICRFYAQFLTKVLNFESFDSSMDIFRENGIFR